MAKCVIFCAGGFDGLIAPLAETDYIIAADGGIRHTTALGLTPHMTLGDFDSLGYTPEGANVFPVEKDDTDAMLAIRQGLKLGCTEFYLYGCLDGPRLDHTIANFQSLQYLADRGARGCLIGKDYIVTLIQEETLVFPAGFEGIVSLFCLGKDADGVTLKGLKYPLENGTLTSAFPLGVSNHFTGEEASVAVKSGAVTVMYDRKNGLPERRASCAQD